MSPERSLNPLRLFRLQIEIRIIQAQLPQIKIFLEKRFML